MWQEIASVITLIKICCLIDECQPTVSSPLGQEPIFASIKSGKVLLHSPYYSLFLKNSCCVGILIVGSLPPVE